MNSENDSSSPRSPAGKAQPEASGIGGQLPQTTPAPPAFNCHVYLVPQDDGKIMAEVANLAGISMVAANERDALRQVVALFKAEIAKQLAAGAEIPWREPPPPPENAVERFLPMHL